jgi:hypothetical protein
VTEKEPNGAVAEAQQLGSAPTMVNGRLGKGGDVDLFAFEAAKGQTVVASLEAHEHLGSPVDAVMQITLPGGSTLAYNHDFHGLDPQIAFVAPASGVYHVRVFGFPSAPNASVGFAGGDAYVYRLTVSGGPFVDHPWPLAVERGGERTIELFGWNIADGLKTVTVQAGDGQSLDILDDRLANVASVAVEPHACVIEGDTRGPQPIALPTSVSGRIDPGDVDVYEFSAKKGEPLELRLASRALGYALDAVLEVTDHEGKSLARVDDAGGPDPLVAFTPPADANYRVVVSDLVSGGGPHHVYLLRAGAVKPDYAVAANAHAYEVAAGKTTEIALTVDRRNGFSEPIAFSVTGLPSGVTASPVESPPTGDAAKAVKLTLTAPAGTAAHSGPIRIEGRSTGAGKLSRTVTAATSGGGATIGDLWLTVRP